VGRAPAAAVFALFAGATPANAAPPSITISASATAGAAPLAVTFEAHGDAASYRWQLGNGETAEGPTASATYGPGLWTAAVTATAADGATAQATVVVRSVAITLLSVRGSRYGKPALFRGSVVPALAGEPVALYARGREVAAARAAPDGSFRLRLPRLLTPGRYELRTPVASSAPVTLKVRPVLQTKFVGARAVGARLALVARVRPAAAGTLVIRLYRDGKLVRAARAGAAAKVAVATGRIARYRGIVRLQPARGWFRAVDVERARVVRARRALGPRDANAGRARVVRPHRALGPRDANAGRARVVRPHRALGPRDANAGRLVFRYYGGLGHRFQPLLSFAALNRNVSHRRPSAARRLAAALLARAVRSGDALYWEYDFPYQGGAAPWRSGFAQAVAAQALARAGVMLRDPLLGAAAAAAFRGLRRTLLMPLGGGSWIREYEFTRQVIFNAQLQSIISLESYAAIANSAAARRVANDLVVAARRLLPRFDMGCWSRYELGGAAATLRYQTYHVELLRRLATTHPAPIWRKTYLRWSRCLP
jgi:D-glucuronyl C5-epimerase C-terminus/PKD domain